MKQGTTLWYGKKKIPFHFYLLAVTKLLHTHLNFQLQSKPRKQLEKHYKQN